MVDFTKFAQTGTLIQVRVTPRARQNKVTEKDGRVCVYVTDPPEDGRANEAVIRLLSKKIGVAKTRLVLVRGAHARDKLFRVG